MNFPLVYLASKSPRRHELLNQVGIDHRVIPVDVDESRLPDETIDDFVRRLACMKAEAGWKHEKCMHDHDAPVLGADTIVVLGNQVFGKPQDAEHAYRMLSQLADNQHEVISAVACRFGGKTECIVSKTSVVFSSLTEQEINDYWNTGEPRDKAGAYAIQGMGAKFVQSITGSYSGVVGLPLYETIALLESISA